ncbi:MAG: transposase, partial [Candidatus Thermoplasmatota archaeon]
VCVREAAEKLGIKIGENLATDPFPVEAVSTDENAEYSGYHRIEGYKCVLTIDIETNIPLVGEVIGINENDVEKLIPHIRDVKSSGMKPKNHWVDGNFTSTEIIAKAEMCENVHLHYRIEKDWVYHPEASNEKLKREYQKYHKEPDFLVGAHHDFMMRYLVEKGNYDVVGNILRNERMAEYEEAPDSYLDDYHQRNRSESINNHLANNLQTRLRVNRKGKETVESSLCLSILTLLAVAFVKLLNGIKTNLVSLDGLV